MTPWQLTLLRLHAKEDLRSFCASSRRSLPISQDFSLPGSVSPRAKQQLLRETVEHIPHLRKKCFQKVKAVLEQRIALLVDEIFGSYKYGKLHGTVLCANGLASSL